MDILFVKDVIPPFYI